MELVGHLKELHAVLEGGECFNRRGKGRVLRLQGRGSALSDRKIDRRRQNYTRLESVQHFQLIQGGERVEMGEAFLASLFSRGVQNAFR